MIGRALLLNARGCIPSIKRTRLLTLFVFASASGFRTRASTTETAPLLRPRLLERPVLEPSVPVNDKTSCTSSTYGLHTSPLRLLLTHSRYRCACPVVVSHGSTFPVLHVGTFSWCLCTAAPHPLSIPACTSYHVGATPTSQFALLPACPPRPRAPHARPPTVAPHSLPSVSHCRRACA